MDKIEMKTPVYIGAVVCAAWMLVVWLLCDVPAMAPMSYLSMLAVLGMGALCAYGQIETERAIEEKDLIHAGLPVALGGGMLAASILFNSIFLFLGLTSHRRILYAGNVILLAVYACVLLPMLRRTVRNKENILKAEQKSIRFRSLSEEMTKTLAVINDAQSRKALLHLKEEMEYGSHASGELEDAFVERMRAAIEDIRRTVTDGNDAKQQMESISRARGLWMTGR